MTPWRRLRIAVPLLAIYWLMLVGGLAMYTALRIEDAASLVPLWAGAVVGTALGQMLALLDLRVWPSMALVAVVGIYLVPGLSEVIHVNPWMAVVPAGLCGIWSLGDRGALAAWWFPTMIWMLSILDTFHEGVSTRTNVALGCALAAAFILFLRVRESRRVALWRAVATMPLAVTRAPVVLREQPGPRLARAGWTVVVGALTLAITGWLAPRLWRMETHEQVTVTAHRASAPHVAPHRPDRAGGWYRGEPLPPDRSNPVRTAHLQRSLPCCAVEEHVKIKRARVKEYLNLGRANHEDDEPAQEHVNCRVCGMDDESPDVGELVAQIGTPDTYGELGGTVEPTYPRWLPPQPAPLPSWRGQLPPEPSVGPAPSWPEAHPTRPAPPTTWQRSPQPVAPSHVVMPHGDPWLEREAEPDFDRTTTRRPKASPHPTAPATATHPAPSPSVPTSPAVPTPAMPAARPAPVTPPTPAPVAPTARPAPAVAAVQPPVVPPVPPVPTPAVQPTPVVPPTPTPAAPPVAAAVTPAPVAASPVAGIAPTPPADDGPAVLTWIALLAGGALVFQLVALALRPLRRLVTLRHLRRPFWDETVDQRVSNSWQLALVGLRDAGWRPTTAEPPRDFARRVGVDGLERCATILERARHGIGLDATDLADMSESAEAAYRSARGKLRLGTRAAAMVRWPLA